MIKVLLFFIGFSSFIQAQEYILQGKVADSLNNPLSYANVVAIPQIEDLDVQFSITDKNGIYKLKLASDVNYKLTISYLGYGSKKLNIHLTKDSFKDFILIENSEELGEVTIKYTPPIISKKDTIIYNLDSFTSGEERKLRDALKKLPGVEVDRKGNVKVNGKKVTKVLVEDKTFFTGNSKLAVNNIPADAVDKIEVLDNYNEVAMLKGLQDSDDMAMNIKLKDDKKKFVFGDVEAGAGYKERYVIHPNLFFYSPKTNINFIGDLNNQGVKSFTFQDYLEFEGNFGKLLSNVNSYFSLFNSDFTQFLNNQDFTANTDQFGALNISQTISEYTDIDGYVIASNSKTETERATLNTYQNISEPFDENRTISNVSRDFFTIGKISIDYDPNFKEDFEYNSFLKVSNTNSNSLINTFNPSQSNNITTLTDQKSFNLKQNISYSRKLSKEHTATLEATYNFQNDKPITEWLTNQQILQGLIPLQDDAIFNIIQTKKSKSHNFNTVLKDYWVLNNFNHIYTSFGISTSFNEFFNEDLQQLSNGTLNNFNSSGFGNDFKYNFINTFLGLEYKFQIGKATFKPALFYHGYLWRTQQFEDAKTFNKNLYLPQFTTKIEFSNSEKLNFKYRLSARFPSINQLANNFILSSFNRVFKGDSNLENQLYHSAFLSYYKFSLLKGLNLNLSTNYNRRATTIKNVSELNGIESFDTPIMFDLPEQNWRISGRITKKINKIRYKLSSEFDYNDFYQLLNSTTDLSISKSLSSTIGVETLFKDFPNLEINYTKDFSNYKANKIISEFENDRLEIILEYDFLKDFIFKADYTFDNYKNINENIINTFDTANASFFYQKEDSPWGFEINVTNIFDVRYKQQNSFNSFIISDNRTFVLPRIIMLKVSYKL